MCRVRLVFRTALYHYRWLYALPNVDDTSSYGDGTNKAELRCEFCRPHAAYERFGSWTMSRFSSTGTLFVLALNVKAGYITSLCAETHNSDLEKLPCWSSLRKDAGAQVLVGILGSVGRLPPRLYEAVLLGFHDTYMPTASHLYGGGWRRLLRLGIAATL